MTLTTEHSDEVVLLSDEGHHIGSHPRATVHGADTPLHLAFSCWVYRSDGSLLLTRRALTKRTFPGVWTNAFCGHPRPLEPIASAIERHAIHELAIGLDDVRPALPDFRYRAVDASGVVENEICPVFDALSDDEPEPHRDEVMDHRWVRPEALVSAITATPFVFSPWFVAQAHQRLDDLRAGIAR